MVSDNLSKGDYVMEPVRLGVIGCGVIGPSHLKLAGPCTTADVVAVADLIPGRVEDVGERYDIPCRYGSDEELLADDRVEAVVLAMPVADRTPVAFKALGRGRHLLLEKPVAARADDVRKMMALRGDRVVACCSPRKVFTGHAQAAAACVASGALGKIRVVRFRAVHGAPAGPNPAPPPWRESMAQNGGGILVNWSCYDLDYVMSITNWQLEPLTVAAKWWPVAPAMASYVAPGSDADAHFMAMIACEDDIVLSMERAEFSSARTDQVWQIIGTEGTLHMTMTKPADGPEAVVLDRFVPGSGIATETIWEQGQGAPEMDVIRDFTEAIRQRREPQTNLGRALIMQRITDAIYASSEAGSSVPV